MSYKEYFDLSIGLWLVMGIIGVPMGALFLWILKV